MTFEEILDQAIALLQRRGRVTYRTLKQQFQLDDAALEDLTIELIKGQRLAVDEDGEVLVWIGAAGTMQESAALPSPPPPQPGTRRQRTRESVPAMAYRVTDLSEKCIGYLALSGRNIATASREEKDLC